MVEPEPAYLYATFTLLGPKSQLNRVIFSRILARLADRWAKLASGRIGGRLVSLSIGAITIGEHVAPNPPELGRTLQLLLKRSLEPFRSSRGLYILHKTRIGQKLQAKGAAETTITTSLLGFFYSSMAPLIPRFHLWEIDDQPW